MEGIIEALRHVWTRVSDSFVSFVPHLVTAIVVLSLGLILAKIIERILRKTLQRIKFDALLERLGVTDLLQRIGVKDSPSQSTARLAYFVLVILFVQAAADSVGLGVISDAIASFFAYMPSLVAAVLILLLGNVVARFAARAISTSARESGVEYATAMGRTVSAGIMFIVAIMAIAQLGIDTAMIRTFVIAALAGGALAFALSFGLGTREVTRNLVAGFYARKLYRVGEPIEVDEHRGTLSAVTPTKTVLDQDGTTVTISNAQLMEKPVKQ